MALLHQTIWFTKSDTYCLKFRYYMNGADVGQLNVYDGALLLWSLHGSQGELLYNATVNIKRKPGVEKTTVRSIMHSYSCHGRKAITDRF